MASAISVFPSTFKPSLLHSTPSLPVFHSSSLSATSACWVSTCIRSPRCRTGSRFRYFSTLPLSGKNRLICRAAEYKFPDPIPEFADAETEKFRNHLVYKLSKKDLYGDSLDEVVGICTEIFSTFLHTEYGGPGTLLVIPFIDMADTLNERGLPGGPQAARAAVKWAQDNVDKDWKEWNGGENNQ
ncbi:hypothetical protein NMG60_11008964 [Bertholletia excelsa]